MLPRLRAEEKLADYAVTLAAGGLTMEEQGREDFVETLERRAQGLEDSPAPLATAAMAASMGIHVERVPIPAPPDPKPKPKPRARSAKAPSRRGKAGQGGRSKPGSE